MSIYTFVVGPSLPQHLIADVAIVIGVNYYLTVRNITQQHILKRTFQFFFHKLFF